MRLGRFQAYLLIAIIGYVFGVVFYFLGRFVGRYISEVLPSLAEILRRPEVSGLLISGLIGMFIAIILAYIWAIKSTSY